MADPTRRFEVIEGGASKGVPDALIDMGTVGVDKPRLKRPAAGGGGRGGGGQAVTIARLETRVTGAFTWLGILTAAFGGAFLFYLYLMFGVRSDIASINQNVAVQGKAISGIKRSLDRIESKLDSAPAPIEPEKKKSE